MMTNNIGLARRASVNGDSRVDTINDPPLALSIAPCIASNDNQVQKRRKKAIGAQPFTDALRLLSFNKMYRSRKGRSSFYKKDENKSSSMPGNALFCLLCLLTFFMSRHCSNQQKRTRILASRPSNLSFNIRLLQFAPATSQLFHLPDLDAESKIEGRLMDYGGLFVAPFEVNARLISPFDEQTIMDGTIAIKQRNRPNRDDDMRDYFAFDDDVVRDRYFASPEETRSHTRHCRRTNWHRLVFPTCNLMHELAVESPASLATYLR